MVGYKLGGMYAKIRVWRGEGGQGMHVSPAKHSDVWLPRKCEYRTDTYTHIHIERQTNARQSDPCVPLCHAGDTKRMGCNSEKY